MPDGKSPRLEYPVGRPVHRPVTAGAHNFCPHRLQYFAWAGGVAWHFGQAAGLAALLAPPSALACRDFIIEMTSSPTRTKTKTVSSGNCSNTPIIAPSPAAAREAYGAY